MMDHATYTLILALTVGNKVSKVNMNLKKVPTTDIIHLNKETGDILNTRLLKATLQISKLEASKTKTLDLLRKVRIENKALKIQINNLQNESIQIDGPAYVRTLQQTSNQNTRYSNRTQNHFYINRRPLRGGNLLQASSIQNNFTVPSLASTHTYILKIGADTMGQNHGPI